MNRPVRVAVISMSAGLALAGAIWASTLPAPPHPPRAVQPVPMDQTSPAPVQSAADGIRDFGWQGDPPASGKMG